ncbi:Uncharacterised protein [Serratia grimesii]|nr:Uncharacterised protein [Serratia grimesii]
MRNHAPHACTRSLRQASQKKGCFRAWGTVKAPQQNQHCSGGSSISEVFDFGYNGGNDLMSFFPAAVNHHRSPFPLEWADIKSYRRSLPF